MTYSEFNMALTNGLCVRIDNNRFSFECDLVIPIEIKSREVGLGYIATVQSLDHQVLYNLGLEDLALTTVKFK